jgi:hypothetical protein
MEGGVKDGSDTSLDDELAAVVDSLDTDTEVEIDIDTSTDDELVAFVDSLDTAAPSLAEVVADG